MLTEHQAPSCLHLQVNTAETVYRDYQKLTLQASVTITVVSKCDRDSGQQV
jgi:hypothetical protein